MLSFFFLLSVFQPTAHLRDVGQDSYKSNRTGLLQTSKCSNHDHLRTHVKSPTQSCSVGWVGDKKNLGALPGHEDPSHWPDVELYQIFLWDLMGGLDGVGWAGVGWGGAALHWPDLHRHGHLIVGGVGWSRTGWK